MNKRENIITIVFSFIFSLLVTVSNYFMYLDYSKIITFLIMTILLCSGVLVFFIILKGCYHSSDKVKKYLFDKEQKNRTIKTFILTFSIIAIIDLLVLFLSQYPGVLTNDSINQIGQINSGVYSNHHPYWHTIIIKTFYDLGHVLFGNTNAAIATYSVFQIIVMTLIESYANMTLCQLGTKRIVNIIFCLSFVVLPYNMIYSFTVWKDILFGGFLLLFITCLVRVFKNIGNRTLNYLLFTISCFGFCLLRSNGWYAFILTILVFLVFTYRNNKKLILIMILCLTLTYIMQHPLLNKLNVAQPDLVESLSIPIQQISRVVAEGNDIDNKDLDLLNKVCEVTKIKNTYRKTISDPIKDLIREGNNQDYLQNNIKEYIELYIKLGLKHPLTYLYAYIDQTRGYYNNGYKLWICAFDVMNNSYGIKHVEKLPMLTGIIQKHYYNHFSVDVLNPFISIGLHVWLLIGCLYMGIMKRNKNICMIVTPLLAIVATLLIATPVFSEFRYAYAVFTCTYFIILVTTELGSTMKTNVEE